MRGKTRRLRAIAFVVATAVLTLMGGARTMQITTVEQTVGLPLAIFAPREPRTDAPGPDPEEAKKTISVEKIRWKRSKPLGTPWAGSLVNGVRLPAEGRHFFTWNAVKNTSPNPAWRRYGTDRLVRLLLRVVDEHARAHPDAPRLAISDLSRPRGGDFGSRFGGLGHSSHQNGLDVDIYYPRKDRRERAPSSPSQIDRVLAQDLVDRFVRAGAQFVFVGPNTGLTGRPRIVQPLVYHDDHMHVRIR